jgi:hypothetical protein
MECLKGFCSAAGIVPRMQDLGLLTLVSEFFRQDPFRAFGLVGLACVALSVTTNFDLLEVLGFVDVAETKQTEANVV